MASSAADDGDGILLLRFRCHLAKGKCLVWHDNSGLARSVGPSLAPTSTKARRAGPAPLERFPSTFRLSPDAKTSTHYIKVVYKWSRTTILFDVHKPHYN